MENLKLRAALLARAARKQVRQFRLPAGNNPYGVDNAREITQNGEQDVNPELRANTDLQEYADRR